MNRDKQRRCISEHDRKQEDRRLLEMVQEWVHQVETGKSSQRITEKQTS